LAGGFLAPTGAHRLDDLRRDRQEVRDGDRTFIREPGRTIIEGRGRSFIVHDENDRFRALGLDIRRERRGNTFVDTIDRPGGEQILTFTDVTGRLLRRVRRLRDGREFILIDNGDGGHLPRYDEDVIALPPPVLRIPRERYIVDDADAGEGLLYDTLIAPPVAVPPRLYTLDQIRYSPDIRSYARAVEIDTINFETGSWDVPAAATGRLRALAAALKRAIDRDPNSVFLVEGFTDATGNPDDNLSLSDRRAQAVAEILTKAFGVPPENLVTQGYGQQNLKEDTRGPSAANRRVVVQNITRLLAARNESTPPR
jgi:outer membrane protein OmpA-like peptidoglycan-associated protein